MNTHASRSVPTTLPSWDAPDWYRALTLPERVAARAGCSERFPAPDAELLQKAQHRLYAWKQQTPFDSHSYFAQRLAMDGIAEEELLKLLAESDEVLRARLADAPEWLVTLGLSYTCAASGLSVEQDLLADLPPTSDQNGPLALLQPFHPLLQWGITRLQTGIQQSSQQWNCPPFAVQSLYTLFVAYLPELLLPKVGRTLVLEMHVAKLRGQLPGETPQERFERYIERLNDPDVLHGLLEEYCVLARQLVVSIERWVDVSLELVQRLAADWPVIRATFAPQSDPGSLIKVSAGAGDLHRGGRSVTILEFASGLKLVYKPKSLAVDQHFQELLAWLNAHGQQPPLRLLRLLDRGAYGWVEFIEPAPCHVREEVARFYERQGSYLALLYALEATDMHYENVIATGEHPMFVDLEALFHPQITMLNSPLSEHPTHRALSSSVLRIGMLPLRLWTRDEFAGLDVSGLGGEAGQVSPYTVPSWEHAGTDEMQLTRRHVLSESQQNRPTLNGHDVQVLDYGEQFVQGFTSTYQLLIAHREDLYCAFLPRFARDEVRCLLRNTKAYKWLLFESFHPNVLRDALQRERTFDRLWLVVNDRPYLTRLIAAERADLQQGDIPFFTTTPESRDLCTSQGQRITDFFAECSLDIVHQRLESLNGEDLARQSWLIQA
ncbi:MAG TPA: type 2 lanthipeptide synthetase LanM, partial [Ktedonobacteraceae bacterium]|nr:type 2 lanthipeptide synthetase LanM [Ktedonobacteraceae bacterium]